MYLYAFGSEVTAAQSFSRRQGACLPGQFATMNFNPRKSIFQRGIENENLLVRLRPNCVINLREKHVPVH